jgi:hypothetical protein
MGIRKSFRIVAFWGVYFGQHNKNLPWDRSNSLTSAMKKPLFSNLFKHPHVSEILFWTAMIPYIFSALAGYGKMDFLKVLFLNVHAHR